MEERKGGILAILGAGVAIVGVKGCSLLTKFAGSGVDDAARAASSLAPVADDAVRTAAGAASHVPAPELGTLADDASKAALSSAEHSTGLVDDGGKFVKQRPQKGMTDSERIVEAAKNYARHQNRQNRNDDEEEKKARAKQAR